MSTKSGTVPGSTGRQVSMALDFVEKGSPELFSVNQTRCQELPKGLTSKMLYSDVVRIAWPSLVEFTLTQLTSMADMVMVGQLGPWAITAVGLTSQPKFLLMAMFMAMNVGATALVARHKGAGNQQRANDILRQALLLSLMFSIVASVVGFFFSEQLVRFMGAADNQTLLGGTTYLRIQMVGFVFMALTSTITATLRGVGNSRTAMLYHLVANIVNVLFNFLLINGRLGFPRMELAGASLATVIGQCVAFGLAMSVILGKKQYLNLKLKDGVKIDFACLRSIFRIGFPAMIEQLVMRTGVIIYAITVASLGTVTFATHHVCLNIQALSFMIGQAFAVSATSLVGQSLGKMRPDMAQAYSNRTRRLGMVVAVLLGFVFLFFGKQIVSLYSDDAEVITKGARILMLVAFIQPFQSSQFILAGALRGAGDTRATAVITFLTVLLVRPGLALFSIHVLGWGLEGAWFALASDQLLRSLLVLLRYNSGKWKIMRI